MTKWILDKESKVPLYLQLKDQIRYHISTGSLSNNEQLPAINKLAEDLVINFETVRKAYKELEKEGLISMQRAKGTVVTLDKGTVNLKAVNTIGPVMDPEWALKNAVAGLLKRGRTADEIRAMIDSALDEAATAHRKSYIIFTECNEPQAQDISAELREMLNEDVRPVLLSQLVEVVDRMTTDRAHLRAVVTTGFHLNDVRAALGERQIDVHVLITNMSPESRRKIDEMGAECRFGFICRDAESIPLYNELLRGEFGKRMKLTLAHLGDKSRADSILSSVDILLASPPVYREVKKMAPPSLPVINVFDRIDPMSVRVLKERLQIEP